MRFLSHFPISLNLLPVKQLFLFRQIVQLCFGDAILIHLIWDIHINPIIRRLQSLTEVSWDAFRLMLSPSLQNEDELRE